MEKSRKQFIGIMLIMVFMIALTRGLTISHNMELHPDEHVFFNAAQSLKGYISGSSPVYVEEKEYPEGAIVLQLPFHILSSVIARASAALTDIYIYIASIEWAYRRRVLFHRRCGTWVCCSLSVLH